MQVSSIITMEDTPELRLGVRCVSLQLFEHNEKAYRAAVQMMEECGKAAIVHPTGTGKSYIAFKLIEEHPADTIFWLSPSEYIFKTQIENLKRQAPDISLANVHFYTYAKLMCCATEELEAIAGLNPTYIILDEFHRVGAECWGYLQATAAAIEKFATYLIGKDPFRIEDYNQNFLRSVYFRGSVIMSAISAIDIALWDIKGKALGVPVYELLGGKTREKVRVYASVMHLTEDKQELAKQYQQLQEMGFTAAKIFCNGPTSSPDGKGEFFSSRIEREVEKVRVAREAVGPDFDFVLEVHRGMTLPEAVAFGRAVEPYRPMILEDPVPPDNVDTMAEVASKVGGPIATGERAIDLREFEVLMARHACQYVRPDVCAVGGITTSKKICALAEAHDVLVIPHNPLGPVSTAACLQICASIPNLGIQELPGFCLNGAEDRMVKEPLRFENGCMLIPEAPGIGVELADDAEELYPANERGSTSARRAFDGSVKDW